MPTVEINHWTYETGIYNKYTAHSYQAAVRDGVTGAIIDEGPVRDTWDDANEDARQFRETLREQERS